MTNNLSRPPGWRRPCAAPRRGAALVEFAVVAPIIFMTFFAILEFGRYQILRMATEEVAYEACRAGVAIGATARDIREVSQRLLAANGIKGAKVEIEPTVLQDSTPQVTVRVTAPLRRNLWVGRTFLHADVVGQSTLDHENSIYLEWLGL